MQKESENQSSAKSEVFSDEHPLRVEMKYHLQKTQGLGLKGVVTIKDAVNLKLFPHVYKALALAVRDRIMDNWIATNQQYKNGNVKQLFYLSAEYLTGRFLGNNLINLGADKEVAGLIESLGLSLNEIEDIEMDAGLGNGGLGRLAACYLDSMATQQLPGHGYGLRYDYGIFRQEILDGYQVEHPDQWLQHGNPWEIKRREDTVMVRFGGRICRDNILRGKEKTGLKDFEEVAAVPFDTPIIGYRNGTVNTLRLWSTSVPDYNSFNISAFDVGDYENALKNVISHDDLTMVAILYPNDNHDPGKRLRLKQQYILVSASTQDIFRTYKKRHNNFDSFHETAAIQINDTHPSLVVTELMRLLVDEEGVAWDKAWDITVKTCAYTNHTIMREALEEWDCHMMKELIPRNYEIIEIINHDFCKDIWDRYSGNMDHVRNMSIIENGKVRMANLAVAGSHSVNGVAELHTRILKEETLHDFHDMFPGKLNNKTNGITPRRWLLKPNPELAGLITGKIGDKWITDLFELKKLEEFANDSAFLTQLMEIKRRNKEKLRDYIYKNNPVKDAKGKVTGLIEIDVDSIFDVQAKRLHEYKRQLMNALYILMLYNELKSDPGKAVAPRTFMFAAKSAPGYHQAKSIIKFINILARVINNDNDVNDKIKVVFLENYNVSLAEKLLIAADVSEQISTAGFEASGTGNMKLALNGALTIGTMDGANVEMSEEIGLENMFIFGLTVDDVKHLRQTGYDPMDICDNNENVRKVIDQLSSNELTDIPEERGILQDLAESLARHDAYFTLKDLLPFKDTQEQVAALYNNKEAWAKMALLNIARMGKFSSDRSILQYNDDIWKLKKTPVGEKS